MSTPQRHSIEVVAETADIDEQDHVSNLVYLRWAQGAARAHSDARGWDRAAYLELGATWFVRRHEIDYLRAARLGATITVTTWVESWKRASCVRCTEITADDGSVLARVATTWALVELTSGRPTRIPEALQARF
jgi:acyl-CoA thioester hydrolase